MRQCLWITCVPSGFTYSAILYYVKLCLWIHEGSRLIPSSFHLTRIHVPILCCSQRRWRPFFFFWTWLLFFFLLFNYWSHVYKGAHWTWQGVRTSEEKKEWVEINLLTITVLKCACFCICVSAVVQRMHFEWRNMSCLRCMYLTGWGNQDHGFEATRNKRRSRRLHTFHLQHFLIRYFFFHSCSKENLHSWQLNFKSFTFQLRSETMHWLKLVYI